MFVFSLLTYFILLYLNKSRLLFISTSVIWLLLSIYGIGSITLNSITFLIIMIFSYDVTRKKLISNPIYNKILCNPPKISKTEQQAIDAGTTWIESDLFKGQLNWKKFFKLKVNKLTDEEKEFINNQLKNLCRIVNDWEITHEKNNLPPEVWKYLKKNNFFGLIIPKKYGGKSFSTYAQSVIIEKLSALSSTLAITVGVPNSLGPAELILKYGNNEQKEKYLPKLASGDEIPCFALTSPESGSDAASISDYGIVSFGKWNGEECLGIELNWNKRYITLAPIATLLGLAFKLKDPNKLLGISENIGITLALVPTNLEGIQIGRRHLPLNIPFLNGPTSGHKVFIPIDFIIGGKEMAGQGWRMLMECLSVGRGITLPSTSNGVMKSITLTTGCYAAIRNQFKTPICEMEGIQECFYEVLTNCYNINAITNLTINGIDSGEKPTILSGITKYQTTKITQKSLIYAMNILGGKAICLGPKNFIARLYQGAPISETVEGANILSRSLITFGQGALRCHPFLIEEIGAVKSHDKVKFDKILHIHLKYLTSKVLSSFFWGFFGTHYKKYHSNQIINYYCNKISYYSDIFYCLSDLCIFTLQDKLKKNEMLSGRMADFLSLLVISTSDIKYCLDNKNIEKTIMVHSINKNLYQIEKVISEIINNFPNKYISKVIKLLSPRFYLKRKRALDSSKIKLVKFFYKTYLSETTLFKNLYLEDSMLNPVGKIFTTYTKLQEVKEIFIRICEHDKLKYPFHSLDKLALKAFNSNIINKKEMSTLCDFEYYRKYTINVDDFDPENL